MANSIFRKKSIAQIQADAAAGFANGELVPGQPAGEGVTGLRRSLGTFDLTMLGIAAIIGAGIFAMVGQAADNGGPGRGYSVCVCGYRVWFRGTMLRGVRVEDTDRRLGLHLCVREFWRIAGLDHRLGPARRIRHRQYRRRDIVERLFYRFAQGKRHQHTAELDDGLSHGLRGFYFCQRGDERRRCDGRNTACRLRSKGCSGQLRQRSMRFKRGRPRRNSAAFRLLPICRRWALSY